MPMHCGSYADRGWTASCADRLGSADGETNNAVSRFGARGEHGLERTSAASGIFRFSYNKLAEDAGR